MILHNTQQWNRLGLAVIQRIQPIDVKPKIKWRKLRGGECREGMLKQKGVIQAQGVRVSLLYKPRRC
jgi:hypothetical protein